MIPDVPRRPRPPHTIVSTLADLPIDASRSIRVVIRQRPGEAGLAVIEEARDGVVKRSAWIAAAQLDAVIEALGRARAELPKFAPTSTLARIARQRLDAVRGSTT